LSGFFGGFNVCRGRVGNNWGGLVSGCRGDSYRLVDNSDRCMGNMVGRGNRNMGRGMMDSVVKRGMDSMGNMVWGMDSMGNMVWGMDSVGNRVEGMSSMDSMGNRVEGMSSVGKMVWGMDSVGNRVDCSSNSMCDMSMMSTVDSMSNSVLGNSILDNGSMAMLVGSGDSQKGGKCDKSLKKVQK
jgi:hypothetical protein